MKFSHIIGLGLFVSLLGFTGEAFAKYEIVPDKATTDCQTKGFYGKFELRRYEDNSGPLARRLYFVDTKKELPVTQSKTNPNFYSARVRCASGCDVALDIELDLGVRTFLYKRTSRSQNIDELCRGEVKTLP